MKYLKRLSFKIADLQARLILSLVFILILPFFALLGKILTKRIKEKGTWGIWNLKSDSLDEVSKQY